MRHTIALLLTAISALPASAVPIVDGTLDAEYGPPIAVQAVQTGFGDANPPGALGGSELDAAYATITNGRLYLMITGNLEPNFNKLEIFIDSTSGGNIVMEGIQQYDFSPSPGFWTSQNLKGLRFEGDQDINFHLFSAWGGPTSSYVASFVNNGTTSSAPMVPGSSAASPPPVGLIASGVIPAGNVGPNASETALKHDLEFAINNNNTAGVTAGTGAANAADAAAVTTGMEFSIALADLGPNLRSYLSINAMINNADHNYLSNQFLGPLVPPQGNLGGDGNGGFTGTLSGVNLQQFAGLQYFRVPIPEPSTAVLAGLALLISAPLVRRLRRARPRLS